MESSSDASVASSAFASASSLAQKMKDKESERGIALAPDVRDLRPWYTSPSKSGDAAQVEEDTPLKSFEVDSEEAAARYKAQQKK